MRVLVTGATGFVGRWLVEDLVGAGHEVVATPASKYLDLGDGDAFSTWLRHVGDVDAVAHLAGIAFGPDAGRDPGNALAINVGATLTLFEVLRSTRTRPAILVSGSSDVYGDPEPEELPLEESARLRPSRPYAWSKVGQEAVALAEAQMHGFPVVATRSFNHTGPGQRREFVVPALAYRILDAKLGRSASIPIGNLDVKRDFSDVRDVVRAYRMLLEVAVAKGLPRDAAVVNVASGRSVPIRKVAEDLCLIAGVKPLFTSDPALIRSRDPLEMRGSPRALTELTGWTPTIPLEQTLRDVWAHVASSG